MSYQVGGFTLVVPEDRVVELDWSFEEAMRYVLTAGVKSPQEKERSGLATGPGSERASVPRSANPATISDNPERSS
ncbi:MAG: hypothetical protein ACLFSZ_10915 [Puniceicoccaceae bacterium]